MLNHLFKTFLNIVVLGVYATDTESEIEGGAEFVENMKRSRFVFTLYFVLCIAQVWIVTVTVTLSTARNDGIQPVEKAV